MSADAESEDLPPASDAFAALGNERRTEIVEAVARAEREERRPMRFGELFAATGAETTAGFAYHLDALVGPVIKKLDEPAEADAVDDDGRHGAGYELTATGRSIARALAAGTYAPRAERSIRLEEPCPWCGEAALAGRTVDGLLEVSCSGCDRGLLSLTVPAGLADREELPAALDRHHRHRIAAFSDGRCPECGGDAERSVVLADGREEGPRIERGARESEGSDRSQATFECTQCGHTLRTPLTLALLDHPAVVSFYHDHGRDADGRALWNVGSEWAESVLSTDPFCVRVVADLAGDTVALYVDDELSVREVQRTDRPTLSSPA